MRARRVAPAMQRNPNPIWYQPTLRRWLMWATTRRPTRIDHGCERVCAAALLRALHELAMSAHRRKPVQQRRVLFGPMPDLWDPAEHEPDDVAPLKRVDEKLCAREPHPLEILRVEEWIDGLPKDLVHGEFPAHLESLMVGLRDQLEKDWEPTELDELIEARRRHEGLLDAD
jgi:hypothetical protein